MNQGVWITKKLRIGSLIKKVSDYYGGDDPYFLKEYCAELISKYTNNIDKALYCFMDLEGQLKYMKKKELISETT